jgi:hypothetical protein
MLCSGQGKEINILPLHSIFKVLSQAAGCLLFQRRVLMLVLSGWREALLATLRPSFPVNAADS